MFSIPEIDRSASFGCNAKLLNNFGIILLNRMGWKNWAQMVLGDDAILMRGIPMCRGGAEIK